MTITELHTYQYRCEGGDRDDAGQWIPCRTAVTRTCEWGSHLRLPEGWGYRTVPDPIGGVPMQFLLCPFHAQQAAREEARA